MFFLKPLGLAPMKRFDRMRWDEPDRADDGGGTTAFTVSFLNC
jgi:hypothetical protein